MIESGLRAAGVRTGLYTSPHLAEPTERIQIGGEQVTREEFVEAFDIVHKAAEGMAHPTYFETVTAMAFVLFQRRKVEIAVLEVGMGGRLDATNVVTPVLSVITPVDFDHEAYLGRSIEAIAGEKAGILKPGIPAVVAAQRPEAAATIRDRAASVGSPLIDTSEWRIDDCTLTARGSKFVARKEGEVPVNVECPLAGEHQVENARTAVAALRTLEIDTGAIERGIAATRWPGRLELVATNPEIIVDGAHNPAGARALASYIERFYSGRNICLVYGAMRDKAVTEVTGVLFPTARTVIATAPAQERAARPETIRELSGREDLIVTETVADALKKAKALSPDVIFVTGSLFVVAEARLL